MMHCFRIKSIFGLYLLTPWSRVLLEKLTGFAANQEIPRILWNPKVHYRTHKRPHFWVISLCIIRFCTEVVKKIADYHFTNV